MSGGPLNKTPFGGIGGAWCHRAPTYKPPGTKAGEEGRPVPTLRRRLSRYIRTPALEARAKRVRHLVNGDAKYRLRQLIRVSRALRLLSRNPPRKPWRVREK